MQQHYDVIIVGGGIVGCSIAYHLSQISERSICVLERAKLTSGTTWHAAGLVAQLRASANLTRLAKYSGELYETIQEEGEALGFRRPGALSLATQAPRAFELQKQAAMARHNAVDCQWLSAAEIAERWPHLLTDDLHGGVYMPRDGQTNPVDTTLALARLARQRGVTILEDTPVLELLVDQATSVGVRCDSGEVYADQVVLCAGLWTRDLGLAAGAHFPLYPAEHFYAVTEPVALTGDQPIVRVPDDGIYLKPDAGRLLIGCFEQHAKPIAPETLGADFSFAELPFDLEHFAPYLERALTRMPTISDTGIRTWFNGPESFTPDGRYILGESPQVRSLFVAAGFNSIGIQSAGGVGQVMAHWLTQNEPPMDLWEVDVRRFLPHQNATDFLRQRTAESLGRLYAMHWPFYQYESARQQRLSPVHHQLAEQGACFGEVAGWERANWYGQPGSQPRYNYTYAKPDWFAASAAEVRAVREDVALFDQTSFAKYLVRGAEACRFLNYLCTANMDIPVGRVVYCQWLNPRGGIEADVTITRLHEGIYWVVSAAASAVRDLHWLARHQAGFNVQVDDITERYAVFGLMGPRAREHLQALTPATLANEQFPFGTSQQISLADVLVRATRITYVGELGWELYVPWEQAERVYQHLTRMPVTHAGYHAMDSLRLEKGYRHWGHDITDEDTPVEAGLTFTVDWETDFLGKTALQAQYQQRRNGELRKRLTALRLHDNNVLLEHDEPIWQLNPDTGQPVQRVGHVRSSAFSHTYQRSLAMGYIEGAIAAHPAQMRNTRYAIEVGRQLWPAELSMRPWYDPDNQRTRC